MVAQDQFLQVIDRDEAERRFQAALTLEPLGGETVQLADALERVLAADVRATVDVPSLIGKSIRRPKSGHAATRSFLTTWNIAIKFLIIDLS